MDRKRPPSVRLSTQLLNRMQRYWHAVNYLTVAQIYLLDNPLLREPLRHEHIKPRLLGHWGTSPGLSLIYVHLNRLINERDANVIYLAGPATAARPWSRTPTSKAPTPRSTRKCRRTWRACSACAAASRRPAASRATSASRRRARFTRAASSGYVLSHAFGAAFDNPDLIVAAVVGDGEAESGPLAGAWKGTSFLNPARDGAVLPILHLNGYKISGPTVLGRDSDDDIRALLQGNGYEAHFVEGDDPPRVHQAFAATLDRCYERIRAIQQEARQHGVFERPRWPAIVLRTPKGWTGPKVVDGLPVEGTFRSHQVPLADTRAPTRRSRTARRLDAQLPARTSCSTPTASSSPSWPASRRAATGA